MNANSYSKNVKGTKILNKETYRETWKNILTLYLDQNAIFYMQRKPSSSA